MILHRNVGNTFTALTLETKSTDQIKESKLRDIFHSKFLSSIINTTILASRGTQRNIEKIKETIRTKLSSDQELKLREDLLTSLATIVLHNSVQGCIRRLSKDRKEHTGLVSQFLENTQTIFNRAISDDQAPSFGLEIIDGGLPYIVLLFVDFGDIGWIPTLMDEGGTMSDGTPINYSEIDQIATAFKTQLLGDLSKYDFAEAEFTGPKNGKHVIGQLVFKKGYDIPTLSLANGYTLSIKKD